MQLSLFNLIQKINWNDVKNHFGKRDEINKDKYIQTLLNRNRGLKSAITRINKPTPQRIRHNN